MCGASAVAEKEQQSFAVNWKNWSLVSRIYMSYFLGVHVAICLQQDLLLTFFVGDFDLVAVVYGLHLDHLLSFMSCKD